MDEPLYRLSDGQHQPSCLACAILPNLNLTILDEDTSTFSTMNDQLFQQAVEYVLPSEHWAPR